MSKRMKPWRGWLWVCQKTCRVGFVRTTRMEAVSDQNSSTWGEPCDSCRIARVEVREVKPRKGKGKK